MRKITFKKVFFKVLFIFALLLFLFFICLPLYWCIVNSGKRMGEIFSKDVTFWPKEFTWDNYVDAWETSHFNIYFKNSAIIAVAGVVGIVLVSIMTGYALDRYQFKGKNFYMLLLLCTQFIPGAMLLSPMYLLFNQLKMLNNLWALVLVNITFRFPYDAVMMRSFSHGIDYTIEDAAQIDGCSRNSTMFHILLPLLKPGIATVAAYAFISCWNEFLYAFMFINEKNKVTLPVGLKLMVSEFTIRYGTLAAGAMIAVAPTLILFSRLYNNVIKPIPEGNR